MAFRDRIGEGRPFTSELSVPAHALSRLSGARPIAQVMGSSVYQVGWQYYPWGSGWGGGAVTTELETLSEAWNDARRRALGRLEEEARLAQADAVVGVTFAQHRRELAGGEVEVVVHGTAVKLPEGAGVPVLSDLSLAEFTLLRQAGYSPVGIVAATSVWYVVPSWRTQRATIGWQRFQPNQELKDFTQGVYYARETAIGRATSDARTLGAHGLVGVTIDEEVDTREVEQNNQKRVDLIATFHVLGTAIREAGEHRPLGVRTAMNLGAAP
jgi:uncharacterized protein YbjQ (UPF0145 family)